MKEDNGVVGIVIIFSILILFSLGIWVGSSLDIMSKERIEPVLKIEVNNGVADTTFVYGYNK